MSEFTGANLYVEFKGTVISGDFREWKDSGEMGLVDASVTVDREILARAFPAILGGVGIACAIVTFLSLAGCHLVDVSYVL